MLKIAMLIAAGCSDFFAKKAMQYSPMYAGDIEFFIQGIEEMLNISRNSNFDLSGLFDHCSYQSPMDEGVMIVESDYNGDVLTCYGYDRTINNRRG